MWYFIYAEDVENSNDLRAKARPAHVERLKKLQEENRLLLAGPFPAIDSEEPGDAGMTGSTIIAKFNSLEEAKEWANNDPYWQGGVYKTGSSIVKPFKITVKMNEASF
jgi:uncharacterized protein YciI